MNSKTPKAKARLVVRALLLLTLVLTVVRLGQAQAATDGATPLGLKPGSPAGSYPLSDFDNVNLYNGNLNFSLPLVTITGRGGVTFPINLRINQKWIVQKVLDDGPPSRFYYYPNPSWWDTDTGWQGVYDVGHATDGAGSNR